MSSEAPALRLQGLTVAYDAQPVLWNVDLDVPRGVIMGIVGPNGAGKSTLLKAVLDIVRPLAGKVEVFGRSYRANRFQVGYVPQRAGVDWDFPISVLDLVLMGTYGQLGWFRRPGVDERRRALESLERVGMSEFADQQIGELSGGQQQRVFLARAFVQDAEVLLMDEPFAGVDATTEQAIVDLMHGLRQNGKTLLIVHHDLTTVSDYFDHVALLNRQIIAAGQIADAFNMDFLEKTYGGPLMRCKIAFEHMAHLESDNKAGDKGPSDA